MHDIKELEDKWKRYKSRQNRVYYLVSILIVVIFSIYFILDKSKFNLKNYLTSSNNKLDKEIENKKIILNDSFMLLDINKKNISQNKEKIYKNGLDNKSESLVDIPILDSESKSFNKKRKIHINIVKTSNINAYKDVEIRFNQSHNIDDGLFLAKGYYENSNYKKSEYWAFQVNKLDPNIEESLLIFIKSKVKLGHKNEALSILETYIKRSDSKSAKKLLYLIENDKFSK